MMGSNNYLGLTHHSEVLAAARAALERYGSGCTGSRFLNGTLDLHEQLEVELAEFFHKESCLVFSTGYQANLGVIPAWWGAATSSSSTSWITPRSSTAPRCRTARRCASTMATSRG